MHTQHHLLEARVGRVIAEFVGAAQELGVEQVALSVHVEVWCAQAGGGGAEAAPRSAASVRT